MDKLFFVKDFEKYNKYYYNNNPFYFYSLEDIGYSNIDYIYPGLSYMKIEDAFNFLYNKLSEKCNHIVDDNNSIEDTSKKINLITLLNNYIDGDIHPIE